MSENEPTSEEISFAAHVLRRLQKGFLPEELFLAVAEKVTMPTMEVAPVRRTANDRVEVLLTQRPANDPYWPNGWHIPGTVIRSTDNEGTDFLSGVNRVLEGELKGVVRMKGELQYVGMKFWDVARGRELDQLFYFETDTKDEELMEGRFFSTDNLPSTTLEHHKIMIPEILEAFERKVST